MNKPLIFINLAIACYFVISIIYHFIQPGQNYVYTKVLLLNLILMPICCFLLIIIPNISLVKEHIFSATALIIMAIGMAVVVAIATLGFRGGFWLVLYLYPIIVLIATKGASDGQAVAVRLGLAYFGSFFLALILYKIFSVLSIPLEIQRVHFDKVWENYSDGVSVMLAATLFAIFNQIPVIRDALNKIL